MDKTGDCLDVETYEQALDFSSLLKMLSDAQSQADESE